MPGWGELSVPTNVRGTFVFLALTVLLRVVGQRESGALSITDLLVLLLAAEAVAPVLSADGLSIPEGLILVATILAWSVVLDVVAHRYPRFGRLLKGQRRPLIEDGSANRRAMRRELMNEDELASQLRLHGVGDVGQVARAYLEPNGMSSVFRRDRQATEPPVKA